MKRVLNFRKFTLDQLITFICYSIGYYLVVLMFFLFVFPEVSYLIYMIFLWPVAYESGRRLGLFDDRIKKEA